MSPPFHLGDRTRIWTRRLRTRLAQLDGGARAGIGRVVLCAVSRARRTSDWIKDERIGLLWTARHPGRDLRQHADTP